MGTQSADTDKGTTPKNMKKRFSFSFRRNRSRTNSQPSGEEKSEASKIDEDDDGKYETFVDDVLGDVANQLATNEDNNDEDSTSFVSAENLDKDSVEVKYKSVEKVLQFPMVRDMYNWATSLSPYLHPAVEKMGPVLDMGLVKLDQLGYKETLQEQTEKVDDAAWKFLEMLEEKYPFLMKPTEHVWREIKVIPAGYFEPVQEFLGSLSLSKQL